MFFGDGLLCPSEGYGEPIVELLTLRRPGAAFKSYHPGEESLTLEAALRGAPAIIGKAPDFVLLGLGNADMARGVDPAAALEPLEALVQLLLLKTQARVAVANVCTAFQTAEARPAAAAFNAGLATLAGDRVERIDLDGPVNAFLEVHRRAAGEKRALHVGPLRLTSMGRVFLSHTVSARLALEELFAT